MKYQQDDDPFERQSRIEWWHQQVLRNAKICVVGAGALGNEVLKNLALLGLGHILILDFDEIVGSNLSRTVLFRQEDIGKNKAEVAASAIKQMMLEPTAKLEYFNGDVVWDLGAGIFRRFDIVIGCVDNDEARLAINRACRSTQRPWIDGGIHGLAGSVTVYAPKGPCFECNVTSDQLADALSRYDSCENVKRRYIQQERLPAVQVTSAVIAALQVQEAIKYLHGQAVTGRKYYFNGMVNGLTSIELQENPNCLAHGVYGEIVELAASTTSTLAELIDELRRYFSGEFTILLGRRFIVAIACRNCGERVRLMRPAHMIYDDELYCATCRRNPASKVAETYADADYIEVFSSLSSDSSAEYARMSLGQLGLPPLHIFTAFDANKSLSFELAGDVSRGL
ncbi:MAG: ThiF family adenylyltransferase [Acidobacteriota bacterium]|nr:ThiF family adenylyltransferase [Blastocatellia bacterium]MDW8412923.1 ThiF family adenylyltransferase [Acidobacteriota bacterium]